MAPAHCGLEIKFPEKAVTFCCLPPPLTSKCIYSVAAFAAVAVAIGTLHWNGNPAWAFQSTPKNQCPSKIPSTFQYQIGRAEATHFVDCVANCVLLLGIETAIVGLDCDYPVHTRWANSINTFYSISSFMFISSKVFWLMKAYPQTFYAEALIC